MSAEIQHLSDLKNSDNRLYRSYFIVITIVVAILFSVVFLAINEQTHKLLNDEMLTYARAYFDTIVATRTWNARYGGVYVEKLPGVEANAFLSTPEMSSTDGRTFVLRNPAMMTREISDILGRDKDFSFRITTNRQLINPGNAPDAFEVAALNLLQGETREVYRTVTVQGKQYFKYMGPLYITRDCLTCHRSQGYQVGDVGGGISVTFSIDSISRKIHRSTLLLFAGMSLITVVLLFFLSLLLRRLIAQLARSRQRIEEMALRDDLTGLHNRRFLISSLEHEVQRSRRHAWSLSCMMIDIDYFKRINDEHGHATGDIVLQEVAQIIKRSLRASDIVGRYGGEEFLIILPETSTEHCRPLAQRVAGDVRRAAPEGLSLTVSIGVSTLLDSDQGFEPLVNRADALMYQAKQEGRDRTVYQRAQGE